MANSNSQHSKDTVLGTNNETVVNQINISIFSNDHSSLTDDLKKEIRSVLEGELINSELRVFLCYPNINKDEESTSCIENLRNELNSINAVVFEGGGKQNLPDTESVYIHIAELDFIKRNCDSIVIFALDEITLSQITLISYYKITREVKSPDLIVIYNNHVKSLDRFFSLGVFQYCDDNNIKIFDIADVQDQKIEVLIRRIKNKKLISKDKGLLGG
jgi:hypothetical protein